MADNTQDEKARREEFARRLQEARKLVDTLPAWKRTSLGPPPIGAPRRAIVRHDSNKPH